MTILRLIIRLKDDFLNFRIHQKRSLKIQNKSLRNTAQLIKLGI